MLKSCEDDIWAIFLFVKAARACQVGHMELSGLQRDGEICALCTTKEGNIFEWIDKDKEWENDTSFEW